MRNFKKILVTGGCGFIGSNFIENILCNNFLEIEGGLSLFNLDKLTYAGDLKNTRNFENDERYEFIEGDICDENLVLKILSEHSIDLIVNFAAESHVDNSIEAPEDFINTNILGTYNLLKCSEVIRRKFKRNIIFIHISTDEVYGSLKKDDSSFSEMNQFKPNSPYSASKASSDHLVRAWNKTYNLNTIITNCSNNYGPNQNVEKLIPKIIFNAINLKPITIYGNGLNIRDWLYVDDHCSAICKVINHGDFGETYNIGGLNEITNLSIAETICSILEEYLPIGKQRNQNQISSYEDLITFVKDRPGHDFRYSIDSKKIQTKLNWSPKENFDSGIRKTLKWYIKKFT